MQNKETKQQQQQQQQIMQHKYQYVDMSYIEEQLFQGCVGVGGYRKLYIKSIRWGMIKNFSWFFKTM